MKTMEASYVLCCYFTAFISARGSQILYVIDNGHTISIQIGKNHSIILTLLYSFEIVVCLT